MPNVEYDSEPALRLERALLVYETGYSGEVTITDHKVKDGLIQPGQPVDVAAFRKLLDRGVDEKVNVSGWTWHFPRLLADNSDWQVWWSQPGKQRVFIGGDSTKPKVVETWVPALVWAANRKRPSCYLFAYDGEGAPTPDTDVYQPSFGPAGGLNHILADSKICVGTMNLTDFTPQSWERAFWSSRFKEANNLNYSKPYACKKAFKKIGTLSAALTRCGSAD